MELSLEITVIKAGSKVRRNYYGIYTGLSKLALDVFLHYANQSRMMLMAMLPIFSKTEGETLHTDFGIDRESSNGYSDPKK